MSTGFLKKPSRPPPPPPIDGHHASFFSNSFSRGGPALGSSIKSATLATPSHRKSSSSACRSRSDYIKISDCHTGLPSKPIGKPAGFKSRASTSFSSTLKPTSSNDYYLQSSHQKSRSLTENHRSSSYLYLDLPSSSQLDQASKGGSGIGVGGNAGSSGAGSSSTLGKSHFGNSQKSYNLPSPDSALFSCNSSSNGSSGHRASTDYRKVDFDKTDALNKCKAERTSGRGSDLKSR